MSSPEQFTSDPWFDSKGKMDDEEPATPEEVHALRDYMSRATSPILSAQRMMAMDESKISFDGKDNRVAWLILDAMMQFPDEQSALLNLVDAIYEVAQDDIGLSSQIKEHYPEWQQ